MALKIQGGKFVMNAGKLSCLCCCPTDISGGQYDSISASKTKCGFSHYSLGGASEDPNYDPNKRYLVKTHVVSGTDHILIVSHGVSDTFCCLRVVQSLDHSWGGERAQTYSQSSCTFSFAEAPASTIGVLTNADEFYTKTGAGAECEEDDFSIPSDLTYSWDGDGHVKSVVGADVDTDTYTPLTFTNEQSGDDNGTDSEASAPCPGTNKFERSFTRTETSTLSVEYTDAMLSADVTAALPAYDDDFNDTAGSFLYVSPDGLTRQERRSRYRHTLPANLVEGRTYNLIYIVRFTPETGSVVDGGEQTLAVTWDGEAEFTSVITVPMPTQNGTNTIVALRWECPDEA